VRCGRSPCLVNCSRSRAQAGNQTSQNINCQRQGRIRSSTTSDSFRASCALESFISCHSSHGPGHLFNFTPSLSPNRNDKMDELLPKLLSFPPHPPRPTSMSDHLYDESIKEQIEAVKKIQQSKLLLQTSGGEHVLDVS
jgi:hypothetical protein